MVTACLIGKLVLKSGKYVLESVQIASCYAKDMTRVIDGKSIYVDLLASHGNKFGDAVTNLHSTLDQFIKYDRAWESIIEMLRTYELRQAAQIQKVRW